MEFIQSIKDLSSYCSSRFARSTDPYRHNDTVDKSFRQSNQFSRAELEAYAEKGIFGASRMQLPSPPLLMLDRITDVSSTGGSYGKGCAAAQLDIDPSQWFFKHHFKDDPLVPGCLLIEAMWQLTGFYLAWSGHEGKGRVIHSGKTRFIQSVDTDPKTLDISVQIRKVLSTSNSIAIANGQISFPNNIVCESENIKVGLFK